MRFPDYPRERRALVPGFWLILISIAALLVACRASLRAGGERSEGAFVERTLVVDGAIYPYQVFVPRAGSGDRPPVILFLHGGGERGTDGKRQTKVGLGPVVRARAASFPALVIFPQAPPSSLWQGPPARAALAALGAAIEEFAGDPDRVYLTGISMGGYGTFELALREPGRFAALVAVCGGLRAPSDHLGLFVDAIPPGERDAVRLRRGAPLLGPALALPRRGRRPGPGRRVAAPRRGLRAGRRAGALHRVPRRRPQLLGPRLPRARALGVAVRPAAGRTETPRCPRRCAKRSPGLV